MQFDAVYYEPGALEYSLGKQLKEKYAHLAWIPIENHNNIEEMRNKQNAQFPGMKRNLIIGIRKTHQYVENHKVSDYLVPFTSSGCTAMCLYCYLVCHYNKCAYLRLFVNREQMLEKLVKKASGAEIPLTFEIGSNSDLVLENTITGNLEWVIPEFARRTKGFLTFPTKFDRVDSLLDLDHRGKTIFRMSLNPQEIIARIELGTSPLQKRIEAVNKMCEAGYPVGILIAPVILTPEWQRQYTELFDIMAQKLSEKVKREMVLEVIFMTYSFVHRAINAEAFPYAPQLYEKELMTGRGRGKYCYRKEVREKAEEYIRSELDRHFKNPRILYIV